MEQARLMFEYSPWFILLCLFTGFIYAALLYYKKEDTSPLNITNKYYLASVRFLLVSFLCFLLIGPFIRQITNKVENPSIVFAIDNSSSIGSIEDSSRLVEFKQSLNQAANELNNAGYQVDFRSFEATKNIDSIQFEHSSSDLKGLLENIHTEYEGRNLASVILLSDGIYNQSASPAYQNYPFPVNTLGMGDTIPKKDLNVKRLFYNQIAYQGNKFPVEAEIENNGFSNQNVNINIKKDGSTVASKQITFQNEKEIREVRFLLEAGEEGMQKYTVELPGQEDEFTLENNTKNAYIEVIQGKEKILLLANAPHPDIKALRKALTSKENYELDVHIPDIIQPENNNIVPDKYDLTIFHHLPSNNQQANNIYNQYREAANAILYITGPQVNTGVFNINNPLMSIQSANNEQDRVGAVLNNNFSKFSFPQNFNTQLDQFPPVTVPFGNLNLRGQAETLLYQKVGDISTQKPLLLVGEEETKKYGIMLGSGIWQWRIHNYLNNESTQTFDALITNIVQYLSSKEDKRRFKVYPLEQEILDTEPVVFETEVYNELYEEVYGQEINLQITGEEGGMREFNYITNENNTRYRVSSLDEGIYQYTATTRYQGQRLTSEGEFTIKSQEIENLNLTANHNLLRNLSEKTGGKFFIPENIPQLTDYLKDQEPQGKIYTSEVYLPIINLQWIFFILLFLITLEWGLRKYWGTY